MPTPNHELNLSLPTSIEAEVLEHWIQQPTTCPPDHCRFDGWGSLQPPTADVVTSTIPVRRGSTNNEAPLVEEPAHDAPVKPSKCDERDASVNESISMMPIHTLVELRDSNQPISSPQGLPTNTTQSPGLSTSYEFSNVRLLPTSSSSFLRAGSRFTGTQQSDRQVYEVQVDLKHVDMSQSFLCGYLRIKGLTDDHPTLTTYFEGEIIGDKYTFQTKHPDWGSNDKVDMQHWNRFNAWRPMARYAKRPDFAHKNFAQRENIFMRWKEHFLVPDHRVRTISGASFEGFYYICFNQVSGNISGIYFHAKSEKYQQLELLHVEDRGCCSAMEFR